jgi:hypothetical protein
VSLTSEDKAEIISQNDNFSSTNNDHINLDKNEINSADEDNNSQVFTTQEDEIILLHKSKVNQYRYELFYGINMSMEYDVNTNFVEKNEEISHENIFELFTEDKNIDNVKIGKIIAYDIRSAKCNYYIDAWPYLLIRENESTSDYYNRLIELKRKSPLLSEHITGLSVHLKNIGQSINYNVFYKI